MLTLLLHLVFLKKVESTLTRLSLNNSFPKENLDCIGHLSVFKFPEIDELSIRKVGLVDIKDIDKIFPNLAVLDLGMNKIFSVEAVEELYKLEMLAEVSFKDNPVCMHKHLKDMVC